MATPRVPNLPVTLTDLKALAERDNPFDALVAFVLHVAVQRARTGELGLRRKVGQRLTGYELFAIFLYAVEHSDSRREIARVFGMDRATVGRMLTTSRFRKFRDAYDRAYAQRTAKRANALALRKALGNEPHPEPTFRVIVGAHQESAF